MRQARSQLSMTGVEVTHAAVSVGATPLLCLTTRPAATSTLFPYTTLFRSGCSAASARWAEPARRARNGAGADPEKHAARDRKSTRLNSSHRTISYAVFCLKKKNGQART